MRTAARWLVTLVIALAALVGLISLFNSRDQSGVDQSTATTSGVPGPGRPYRGTPRLSAAQAEAVQLGNVVVFYRGRRPAGLARGGRAAEQSGQAVLLAHDPSLAAPLTAVSVEKVQQANAPAELSGFIGYWLGH